jgi:hypothetical protein
MLNTLGQGMMKACHVTLEFDVMRNGAVGVKGLSRYPLGGL